MVKLLIETGENDLNSKDGSGWTPLSWAAEGHEVRFKLLLEMDKVGLHSKDGSG